MKKINILNIGKNTQSKFIESQMVTFLREGEDKERIWEIIKSHSSVHILVNNTETKEVLLVKQVRIPILTNDDSQDGVCYEMCAGLVDKSIDIVDIAKEEIEEEMGYRVESSRINFIKKAKSALGTAGNDCFYFEVEVTEADKVSNGGGLDSEDIEVVRIPYDQIKSFAFNSDFHTDSITMFLLTYWLYKNK